MKAKTLLAVLSIALLLAPVAFAQGEECEIINTVGKITNLVMAVGGGLAILALTLVGVMMFNASDPAQKDHLKERLKYIIIGLVIIIVAPMVVKYILGAAFRTC